MRKADLIRAWVAEWIVRPARVRGETSVDVPVWLVHARLGFDGAFDNQYPNICQALKGKKFLAENQLELLVHSTPCPSSTTVFRYRIL